MKTIDVSLTVTCLEEDADIVTEQLNHWFCENETALVTKPGQGVQWTVSAPIEEWMKETLCPWELTDETTP